MTTVIVGEKYRISVLTPKLLRLEYSEDATFEDRRTQLVQNRQFEDVDCHIIDEDNRLEILTPYVHLRYNKQRFAPENLTIDVKNHYTAYGNRWCFGDRVENLKGTCRTLDNIDGSTQLDDGILSKNGYAVLDDSTSFLFDENGEIVPRSGQNLDYYFFGYGRDYYEALHDYYVLTGFTPKLPRYALGNWWSRYWPYSEESYLNLMDRFAAERVPLSVSVLDMDWHIVDIPKRFGSGWTGYSWNRELFPNPKRFLTNLHSRGLVTTLNVHQADGIRAYEDCYPKVAQRLGLDQLVEEPAVFDLTDSKFRNSYFEDVHHPLEEDGVNFWWIDWQQGSHGFVDPLWLLNYYHFLDSNNGASPSIILSRYAGPGSHRYPVGFSGDTIISWDSLKFQPYFTSTSSNIGYTWWSHDIGGHMAGVHDEELALRWLQFGIFSPINRLHSSNSLFNSKEPWGYSETIKNCMVKFLQLRHALIPYLDTMNSRTHEKGIPLICPLYYEYPNIEESYHAPNQYFFGSQLMISPITEKVSPVYKTAGVSVWFPEGEWHDWFTGKRYEGNQTITIFRKVEEIPVFVREGGIIPLDHEKTRFGVSYPKQVDWHLFPGGQNSFVLIEDEEEYGRLETKLTVDWEKQTYTLTMTGDCALVPRDRQHCLIFYPSKHSIMLENQSQSGLFSQQEGLKPSREEGQQELFQLLKRAEISYDKKTELYHKLLHCSDVRRAMLVIQDEERALRLRLVEWIVVYL
ncbi:glycoside hydrolase family 31 protein [Streptococcus cuniculi]|uniref:Alpha-xylosidase n=1 Tax=Streptococcus cuniculi TaxID=1432788 RepID=A0A4Y9JER4_9STRE|nr:TIM-barrel domain-containing protein [Streptococcus cuniculi]MBF0777696.1 glycoside hydrolase family 31 protein [Streptococcus cuniculi]TFU98335.1 alpha-xylosidase [Streptococcus cuniculi]